MTAFVADVARFDHHGGTELVLDADIGLVRRRRDLAWIEIPSPGTDELRGIGPYRGRLRQAVKFIRLVLKQANRRVFQSIEQSQAA